MLWPLEMLLGKRSWKRNAKLWENQKNLISDSALTDKWGKQKFMVPTIWRTRSILANFRITK